MKKILLTSAIMMIAWAAMSQFVSPYSNPGVTKGNEESDEDVWGRLPFSGKPGALQRLYDRDEFGAPNTFSLSTVIRDSLNANSAFTEIISFIPEKSWGKFSASVLMTSEEQSDTTNAPKDVALQKLINGGGNLSIAFSKPLYYNEFYKTNYFFLNAGISAFLDIPAINKKIYNPAAGAQLNIDADFRIVNIGTSAQSGNILRLGVKAGFTKNLFNAAYFSETEGAKVFKNIGFGTAEIYLGLGFLDIRYSMIISNNDIFDDRKSILEVAVMPIKF